MSNSTDSSDQPTACANPKRFFVFSKGDSYAGDLLNGFPHGHGILCRSDGTRYEGEFERGELHGDGVATYVPPEGDTRFEYILRYEGQFLHGRCHGKGRYFTKSCTYVGEFKDGLVDGIGVMTFRGGRYEGGYRRARRHGQGVLVRENGLRYEGEFEKHVFSGHGTLWLPDGRRYEGEFSEGLCHGRGIMVFPNGESLSGWFDHNRFDWRRMQLEVECVVG